MAEVLCFGLGGLTMWCLIYLRGIWITRRQPVRRDAPDWGPWIKPEPKVRRQRTHYSMDDARKHQSYY